MKVLKTGKVPRPVSHFLEVCACDSWEILSSPMGLTVHRGVTSKTETPVTPFVCVAAGIVAKPCGGGA